MFVGRRSYLAALSRAFRLAVSGSPQRVVVSGVSGIGKSALVRHWLTSPATRAAVPTVMQARCDASERDLAFGAMGQLLSGVPQAAMDQFPALRHIDSAGMPFQVGAQLLHLLDLAQRGGPVVLVVDDAQWADPPSLQALGFALRRLEADAVLVILITRTEWEHGHATDEDLERLIRDTDGQLSLMLTGLAADEVAELVRHVSGRKWNAGSVEKLRAHTEGNPLHVQTLLTELPGRQFAVGRRGALPVPSTLAAAVSRQLSALPEDSRRLAEAAAVLDGRAPLAIVGDVAGVEDVADALEPLLELHLLQWWPGEPEAPVAVSHALRREAILATMRPARLREVHSTAARHVSREASWRHRVAAAGHSCEPLAEELERAADEHFAAGGFRRAGTLLLWAAGVSDNRDARERRLLTAAAQFLWGDDHAKAESLVPEARECAPSPLRSLVLGAHATSRGGPEAEELLREAIAGAEGDAGSRWVFAMAATWLGMLHLMDDCERAVPILRRVVALPDLDARLAMKAIGNAAIGTGFIEGASAGVRELGRLVRMPHVSRVQPADAYHLALRGMLRSWSGELTSARLDIATSLRLARDTGVSAVTEFAYPVLAATCYLLGDWEMAGVNAEQGVATVAVEEKPWAAAFAHVVATWVSASRGDWVKARLQIEMAEELAQAVPARFSTPAVAVGHAVLAQARADHAGMLTALAPLLALPETGFKKILRPWWLPLRVEALIGTGDLAGAATALSDLEKAAEEVHYLRLAAAWLSGRLAEERGDMDAALTVYQRGTVIDLGRDDVPLHRGMLECAYSRALRRSGARDSAAVWGRRSLGWFDRLGATPFRDRCLREEAVPAQRTRGTLRFSDRERSIAHLVGLGYTNREIASELYISTKTVEYHLGNIYARGSLRNRRQLRDYLREEGNAV
ncbi:helix-turn-helix transcriptional regulator [Actinokineospora sp. 24-640]